MASSSTQSAATGTSQQPPVAVICIGMAGSGKTTFMQRINAHLHEKHQKSASTTNTSPPYVLNLDPAVRSVPFDSNIDIRDSVNYKEVMKQYNLGPNGGILTSLNLFSTKIDQVMTILEKRCLPKEGTKQPSHILIDTPGQIEVFVWSASGNILLSALASSFPTVIAYVIDTPRTTENTSTFMSNMLYAISILYKTKLPMILVFNKTDVKDEAEAVDWMRDFESFQAAVRQEEEDETGASGGGGYMGSLLNSMSLVLEEFYNALSVVGVSSMTGAGIDKFFEQVEAKRAEFEKDYKPELARRVAEAEKQKEEVRQQQVDRMMKDMSVSSRAKGTGKYAKQAVPVDDEPETISDAEAMDDDAEAMDDDAEAGTRGGLEEPDQVGEEDFDEDAMFEEGLKARYEAALLERGGPAATVKSAEYIRRSQGGGGREDEELNAQISDMLS